MAIETFKRYENKYRVDLRKAAALQNALAGRMILDGHNQDGRSYAICNLYYDTEDSALIRESLSKPVYKEKLRLRSYGVPQADSLVFLEVKKKFCGIVNKRRSAIRLDEACGFIHTGRLPPEKPEHNRQVLKEIAYLLQTTPLEPRLFLAYDRKAYFDRANPDLRVSFDTRIRTRRSYLSLLDGDWGNSLLGPDECLMEIKVSGAMPFWLARLLSEYEIRPVSFSKYGTEYQGQLRQTQRTRVEVGPGPSLVPAAGLLHTIAR